MGAIEAQKVGYEDVRTLRELYRAEANCQLIRDSLLPRGFADPFLLSMSGRLLGYGAVLNKYDKGRLYEFYAMPHALSFSDEMVAELLRVSRATHIEAQTNCPKMLDIVRRFAIEIDPENFLFQDEITTDLRCPEAVFRKAEAADKPSIFPHKDEPVGDWILEVQNQIVATGGFLTHYNPPYADLYMEVAEPMRRKGYGSFLIQELKKVCYEAGKKPAARSGTANFASRATLEKAGVSLCGELVVGTVKPS
jgi:GNAT superfamily N-acetyltransferase